MYNTSWEGPQTRVVLMVLIFRILSQWMALMTCLARTNMSWTVGSQAAILALFSRLLLVQSRRNWVRMAGLVKIFSTSTSDFRRADQRHQFGEQGYPNFRGAGTLSQDVLNVFRWWWRLWWRGRTQPAVGAAAGLSIFHGEREVVRDQHFYNRLQCLDFWGCGCSGEDRMRTTV